MMALPAQSHGNPNPSPMKKYIQTLVAAAAISLSASASHAQATPKILVVDLAKIFDTHWKTKEQVAKLQADQAKAQDQASQMQKDGNALVEQFKELDEQSKNPTATAEAKAKAQADAKSKYEEIQQKQSEFKAFAQNAQSTMRQRSQTFKTLMIEEISKAAVDIAKKKGATFLLDKSGPTLAGVSNILYSDPALDITDEVVAEMNKDRPASAPAAAAPSALPGASPSITVPGTTPEK
jgi:outer membrane protein